MFLHPSIGQLSFGVFLLLAFAYCFHSLPPIYLKSSYYNSVLQLPVTKFTDKQVLSVFNKTPLSHLSSGGKS